MGTVGKRGDAPGSGSGVLAAGSQLAPNGPGGATPDPAPPAAAASR